MTIEERRDLSKARFDRARDCLRTAKVDREIGDFRAAANRSYYAIFHAMRSALALEEVDMSKHSGVMAEFRRRYLKTEILDRKLSAIITQAFEVRNASDYDDFYIVAREDVDLQIENTVEFMRAVGAYLISQGVVASVGEIEGAEACEI